MNTKPNNKAWAMIIQLRPQHWVKNLFVVAPLLFSQQYRNTTQCWRSLLAFTAFCAISSAIYVLNDLADLKEDRKHPIKKNRPLAQGSLSTNFAMVLIIVLVAANLLLSWFLGSNFLLISLIYLTINTIYSFGIKHVAIVDVMTIAAGFVLRIVAGSVAVDMRPSHWLVLCTIMVSLFLGFTKRRAELVAVEGAGEYTRKVLQDYSTAFLDQVIPMVTAATIICYALYTVDDRTLSVLGTRAMLLTVPSVMFGLFRYIYLIYHEQKGADPTELVCRDAPTLINLLIWVLISVLIVTKGHQFDLFN
ncbi:MAG: decaprenyl-phosphate phosphoribosyltransferase [Planctomycetes bacterium]|nr:decaprenyl-phosphate phosphoribosyltransferase [Planctomycetota bacterium]